MKSFNENVMFKLKKINNDKINKNAGALILDNEKLIGVYKTVRDQVIFTDKRIMTVDLKGVTGMQQEIFVLPYSNILYFGIQTVGFFELVPDSELSLFFNNGVKAEFEFRGKNDIIEIGKVISEFSLIK